MIAAGYPWLDEHARSAGVLRWDRSGFVVEPAGRPAVRGRTPVAAVGSNASPAVLARKLSPLATGTVPLELRRLTGVRIGHSAHVSAGGYIPAAPCVGEGSLRVVVGWFEADQLALLDASEPNYVRRRLDAELDGYVSRWGVVAIEGRIVELTSQQELLQRLRPPALSDGASLSQPEVAERVSTWLRTEHAVDAGWPD